MKNISKIFIGSLFSLALVEGALASNETVVDYQDDDGILSGLFLQAGVGYLTDTEEEYYSGSIGKDFGCGAKLFLTYGNFTQTIFSGNVVGNVRGSVEEDTNVFALGATFGFSLGGNGKASFFYGGSIGVADATMDVFATDGVITYKESVSDTVFYADVTIGIEYSFTEHFSLVGQVKYIYLDDYEFNLPQVGSVSVDSQDQLALELGVKFTF